MKSTLKVLSMRTLKDVSKVRNAIANNEGVVACQINKEKDEVEIVFDGKLLSVDKIIESIEEIGYSVM
jgi:copper chaperone CopZ